MGIVLKALAVLTLGFAAYFFLVAFTDTSYLVETASSENKQAITQALNVTEQTSMLKGVIALVTALAFWLLSGKTKRHVGNQEHKPTRHFHAARGTAGPKRVEQARLYLEMMKEAETEEECRNLYSWGSDLVYFLPEKVSDNASKHALHEIGQAMTEVCKRWGAPPIVPDDPFNLGD